MDAVTAGGSVDVHVYGALAERLGPASVIRATGHRVPVGPDSRISDVLTALGIDQADVKHLFLNAQYSTPGRRIHPGDRLGVFGRDMALLYRQYFAPRDDPA
jgi:hypothetical protein